jgi:hypothetical protein
MSRTRSTAQMAAWTGRCSPRGSAARASLAPWVPISLTMASIAFSGPAIACSRRRRPSVDLAELVVEPRQALADRVGEPADLGGGLLRPEVVVDGRAERGHGLLGRLAGVVGPEEERGAAAAQLSNTPAPGRRRAAARRPADRRLSARPPGRDRCRRARRPARASLAPRRTAAPWRRPGRACRSPSGSCSARCGGGWPAP